MSKTIRYNARGNNHAQALLDRIDRHVMRRHTPVGFQRLQELAAEDYARHVAFEVSPGQRGRRTPSLPKVHYTMAAPSFGKRNRQR